MDFEDLNPGLQGGVGELDLSIDSARPQKGRVQNIDSIGSHNDLDGLSGLEPIELIQKLEHCPLDFGIALLAVHSGPTDGIHLVDKENCVNERSVLFC